MRRTTSVYTILYIKAPVLHSNLKPQLESNQKRVVILNNQCFNINQDLWFRSLLVYSIHRSPATQVQYTRSIFPNRKRAPFRKVAFPGAIDMGIHLMFEDRYSYWSMTFDKYTRKHLFLWEACFGLKGLPRSSQKRQDKIRPIESFPYFGKWFQMFHDADCLSTCLGIFFAADCTFRGSLVAETRDSEV